MTLSKSNFKLYLSNPLHFWAVMRGHAKNIPDPAIRFTMREGYAVEELAITYLRTKLTDPNLILRPQFTITRDDLKIRTDLWVETLMSSAADLYEIKSSTRVRNKDVWDIAFQYFVAAPIYDIAHTYLVYINKDYRLIGDIDPSQILIIEDVTEKVLAIQEELPELVSKALLIAADPQRPDYPGCGRPHTCPCPDICFGGKPSPTSIYYLGGPAAKLKELDVQDMRDIADTSMLPARQQKQITSAKTGETVLDSEYVHQFLDKLEFPLYFFDYETINFAIPKYQLHTPQEHMPFQYSLHKLDSPDSPLTHFEFIADSQGDPGKELLNTLFSQVGDTGSILVWYKHFELGRNRYMASIHPEFTNLIHQFNNRVVDLMTPFERGAYVDYHFLGSSSIKKVLPVIAPELSYKNLAIGNGGLALVMWYKMIYEDISEEEKLQIKKDLLEYCKLDTFAMVEIFRFLSKLQNIEP